MKNLLALLIVTCPFSSAIADTLEVSVCPNASAHVGAPLANGDIDGIALTFVGAKSNGVNLKPKPGQDTSGAIWCNSTSNLFQTFETRGTAGSSFFSIALHDECEELAKSMRDHPRTGYTLQIDTSRRLVVSAKADSSVQCATLLAL